MTATTAPLDAALLRKQSSLWTDAFGRLKKSTSARVGASIVLLFVVIALFVPVVMPYNMRTDSDLPNRLMPPSWAHPFGTDDQGRDVFRRILYGSRVSLRIGVISVSIALAFGTTLGLVSGFVRGATDILAMRIIDIMMAFPATLLAIGIVASRGPGITNTMIAVGIVQIPAYCRLARSVTLSVKEREYVTASRSIGASAFRQLTRHVLPNTLSPIIVQLTLSIASSILEAAGLGFLGLGAQPPTPEWGAMLADGYKFITIGVWWVVAFPGLFIMLTVVGFNLFGDGLRDALDPSLRKA